MGKRKRVPHPREDILNESEEDIGRVEDSDEEQRPGLRRPKAVDASSSASDSDADDDSLEGGNHSGQSSENDEGSQGEEEVADDDEIPVAVTGPTVAEILKMVEAGRTKQRTQKPKDDSENEESDDESEKSAKAASKSAEAPKETGKAKGPLNPKELAKFHKVHDRTGVVYLSRIPPFMKPQKIRHLLGQHGAIGRIFLQPEPTHVSRKRAQTGGNRKTNFTEGWVEFLEKKDAKLAAEVLNNNMIGGKKRNFYHDDIWNIKYLPGFKWSHLAERIAYEKAVRDQKIRVETQQARRENRAYLKSVAAARMIEAIEEKKKRKAASNLVSEAASSTKAVTEAVAAAAGNSTEGPASLEKLASQFKRRFKQRKVIDEAVGGGIGGVKKGQEMAPEEREKQKRVLGKIFA